MSDFPYASDEYKKALPSFGKWRDAAAGEDRLKERGERYLPRLFKQTDEEYKEYLSRASYYNATGKTIDATTGAHFRHAPDLALPKELQPIEEEASPKRSLQELLFEVAKELWTIGRVGLLGEFDEEGRPRVFTYKAESIVNGYDEDGALLFVILCEVYRRPKAGERYCYEAAKQYRILELEDGKYIQRVLREEKDPNGRKDTWVEVEKLMPLTPGGDPLDFIPFVIVNYESEGMEIGGSPVGDLVNLNLKHWMGSADNGHTIHLTACAFLEVCGLAEEDRPKDFRVGSSTVLYLPIGGSSKYTEITGAGIEAQLADLARKEDQMARVGGAFLRAEKKAAETAQAMEIRQAGESSVMVRVGGAISKGVTEILRLLGRWLGLKNVDAISVSLSKEFFDVKIDPQEAEFLFKLYQSGLLGLEQLFEGLQGGGILKKEWLAKLLEQVKKGELKPNGAQEDPDHRTAGGANGVLQEERRAVAA